MSQEKKNVLITTLGSLWLGFLCAYGIISVGNDWIFDLGLVVAAIMLICCIWGIINWKEDD